MNGLPFSLTVAAILVGLGCVALMWADERWTRHERELFRTCKCGTCDGGRW